MTDYWGGEGFLCNFKFLCQSVNSQTFGVASRYIDIYGRYMQLCSFSMHLEPGYMFPSNCKHTNFNININTPMSS